MFFLWKYEQTRRTLFLAGSGLAVGLSFLTKMEVFAAAASSAAGLGLLLWRERSPGGRIAKIASIWTACAAFPVAAAWALLCTAMPMDDALEGVLGSWVVFWKGGFTEPPFYRMVVGTDAPLANTVKLLAIGAGWLVLFGPVAWLAMRREGPAWRAAACTGAVSCFLLALMFFAPWWEFARPLPLFTLGLLIVGWRLKWSVARLTFLLFATLLLGRMALNAHVWHYGFALAMPATIVVTVAGLRWVPDAIERRRGDGGLFFKVALGAWVLIVTAHLILSHRHYERVRFDVGSGADRFLADARRSVVEQALRDIERHVAPGDTLAVFPEGIMLNYLSRRVNPTPYNHVLPPDFARFGERRILAALERRPPDFIALVDRNASEYGSAWFGQDYGRAVGAWITERYVEVALAGKPPLRGEGFGIALLRRRP
jgi:hypothetical protein